MPGIHLSDTERRLLNWWENSTNFPFFTLRRISIKGDPRFRGIRDLSIEFRYPLTVVCGKNGVGKTTILALAALAFHSPQDHYPVNALRKPKAGEDFTYYTFKDFFFKGPRDPDITGVEISWTYWDGAREKELKITKKSRKWIHYDRRPKRPVHYLGIIRAIPAQEFKVLRSRLGTPGRIREKEVSDNGLALFKHVMSQPYSYAATLSTKGVSIRSVDLENSRYTSFNMGTGEDVALFILDVVFNTPNGSLIVIDEVEIGLHPESQIRLAKTLQELAHDKKLQIIVSTHSEYFIDAVPRVARVLIQKGGYDHKVIYEPTTRFAVGIMKGSITPELVIYCEDSTAEFLILQALPSEIRKRVRVVPIGSDSELIKQAISHIKAGFRENLIVVWDGDVRNKKSEMRRWINEIPSQFNSKVNITLLPGNQKPEAWILTQLDNEEVIRSLKYELQCSEEDIKESVTQLKSLGNPKEIFHEFSKYFGLSNDESKQILAKSVVRQPEEPLNEIVEDIRSVLSGENVRKDKELLGE